MILSQAFPLFIAVLAALGTSFLSFPAVAHRETQINHPALQLAQSPTLDLNQFQIGGVAIDATEAEVIDVLGEPFAAEYSELGCAGPGKSLQYSGLEIQLTEGVEQSLRVYSVMTNDSAFATVDGVRVGDSPEAVLAAYGEPPYGTTEDGLTYWVYTNAENLISLYFIIENEIVTQIGYFAQIC